MSSFREALSFRRSPKPSSAGSGDETQTAYERRRQQVRRAQRNHRERKATYIKALEQEVVNLRKQNQQNIVTLETEISTLRQAILSFGVDPPPRQGRVINASEEAVDTGPSSYTVVKPPGLGSPLRVTMPETQPEGHGSQVPPGFEGFFGQRAVGSPGATSSSLSPVGTQQGSSISPALAEIMSTGSLDKIIGIDFVLTLEHPCMGHAGITRDEFGTHSHMASHMLLTYAPKDLNGPATWEVPGADIHRLLNMSNAFQLQGEITPVQAWFKLKQHPRFRQLRKNQVEALKRVLFGTVKCYGFGSVMEESDWDIAVEEVVARG